MELKQQFLRQCFNFPDCQRTLVSPGGDEMETTKITFRYLHIFKHIGVLYILFLLIVSLLSYFARDPVILTVLGLTLGLGILLLILYRTFSIQVSDRGITQKTLFGTKSLAWGDIRQISAQGSSLRLRGEHVTISISPRHYGAREITEWLQTKRPGLFRIKHVARLERNNMRTMPMLLAGVLLILLSLLLYIFKDYLFRSGLLGLFLAGQAVISWYLSPRSLVIENDCMTVRYHNRSVTYSADDIAVILASTTQQEQYRSVVIVFRNQKKVLDLSVFKQTPFITFPVLSQWREENSKYPVSV
jgi:hypothetical protein